ncbi:MULTISPECIES: TetR family transcriptional regulator [unclassified Corynebacterium]|uniref:TetR family transcriptional regulator n=1 Tax=unclassified Corynebacterium TaxID=2624378 RepID=UPI0030A8F6BD
MKSASSSDTIPQSVLDAALHEFTAKGYTEARLDAIASASGVSKRMLHYHCGDKMGLYRATYGYVLSLVRPSIESLRAPSEVPVEALQHVVGVVHDSFADHPIAVRFIIQENLHPILPLEESTGTLGHSPIVMEFDRILLLGRDFGAFRTDVSALDLYVMVLSLASFPTLHERTFHNLYNVELTSSMLSNQLREFAQDVVTGFLTSSPRREPGASYTLPSANTIPDTALSDDIYGSNNLSTNQPDDSTDVAPDFTDIYDEND